MDGVMACLVTVTIVLMRIQSAPHAEEIGLLNQTCRTMKMSVFLILSMERGMRAGYRLFLFPNDQQVPRCITVSAQAQLIKHSHETAPGRGFACPFTQVCLCVAVALMVFDLQSTGATRFRDVPRCSIHRHTARC